MLEVLREGGPWKSAGGGRRAEVGCLLVSDFGCGLRVDGIGEVGDTLRWSRSSVGQRGAGAGGDAMLARGLRYRSPGLR
jgi:hypothetical protein